MSRRLVTSVLAVALLGAVGGVAPVATASSLPDLRGLSSVLNPGAPSGPVGEWGSPLPRQPRITVHADGTLGGDDGCNTFGTTWRESGDNSIIIETDRWISTQMYCGWEWFPSARSATVNGPVMTVFDGDGERIGELFRLGVGLS
ncbi:META domain-containing protein [Corynebacterium sp.]|uniref:META domain-containing protein n=1 Tax=Corynebacterium sp. TaxID=1720 RepID=UPI001983D331|nr:META domain-containing protein [Corynebacterium sp.]HHU67385.1 META domain-containing protein [Corynebacterium sp.]